MYPMSKRIILEHLKLQSQEAYINDYEHERKSVNNVTKISVQRTKHKQKTVLKTKFIYRQ